MDAGINNAIYMELNSGPKIANSTCGKTIAAGTIDRVPLYIKTRETNCNAKIIEEYHYYAQSIRY